MVFIKLIAITSPATDAGKTFLATGIAHAAAHRGLRTAFLDYDIAVGDALRVFGLLDKARSPHPTIASWKNHEDPHGDSLKTVTGVSVYSRPENPLDAVSAGDVLDFYKYLTLNYELVVADIGTDHRLSHWETIINLADSSILVVDCDEKALVRTSSFVKSNLVSPPGGWIVAINSREKGALYSAKELNRINQSITDLAAIFEIPFFPGVERNLPKTFCPNGKFTKILLDSLLSGNLELLEKTVKTEENSTKSKGLLEKFFTVQEQDEVEEMAQSKEIDSSYSEPAPKATRPPRVRSGQPAVVLGFGSKNLTDWFNTTFSNLVDIVGAASSSDEFRNIVHKTRPDLVVLMRIGPMGGLPEADLLAEWASEHVPAVLFIAGELDEHGEQMAGRVKEKGVHVLSCPPGETINGDELVVLVHYLVREISSLKVEHQTDTEEPTHQPTINLEVFKKGATQLSSVIKQGTEKAAKSPGLLTRIKSQLEEGLSLEESSPVEMLANTVKNPTAITAGGLFAVVSPWRPGLAGRIAAAAAKMFADGEGEVAVIGASGYSTAAVWLDITDEELMMSDWRVPGSQVPVVKDNIKIWAVDPAKSLHMNIDGNLWSALKEIRKTVAYTVIDFAGDFELAQKVAFQGRAVVLVIVPGGDPVEQRMAMLWLNRCMEGKTNIIAGIDLRGVPPTTLQDFKPKLIIRNSPADAIKMALRKNLDEFIWN